MYPDPRVESFINNNYVPVKIHIKEQPKTFERFDAVDANEFWPSTCRAWIARRPIYGSGVGVGVAANKVTGRAGEFDP